MNSADHSLLRCVLQRTTSQARTTQGPEAQIWGPGASVNSTDHSLLRCVLQRTIFRAWATQRVTTWHHFYTQTAAHATKLLHEKAAPDAAVLFSGVDITPARIS